jgi:hypothetical protein
MPNPNLPVPYRSGALVVSRKEQRALIKQANAFQRRALEVRAEDVARRQVASGRMHDIGGLSDDALAIGGQIGDRLAYEASDRPFFARELADIASTGAHGLKTELAYYIEESH